MTEYTPSVVKYYSEQSRSRCDYCSTNDGSLVYGLHAYTLTVGDYQDMIDRGWRRCGKYCYKAVMNNTCCPFYTIRCAALDFRLSRSQKRTLKRFNNFLNTGAITKNKLPRATEISQPMEVFDKCKSHPKDELEMTLSSVDASACDKMDVVKEIQASKVESCEVAQKSIQVTQEESRKNKSQKAKYLRIERKKQKLQKLGLSEEEISKKLVEKKKYPVIKTIEDYINEPLSKNQVHNFKISLVRCSPRSVEFDNTFEVTFDLYKRYQRAVHNDSPERLTQSQFEKFLVISPLQASGEYGTYHQQYWLDDKLIAVGVIDILPKCVSSIYFFYDPDYSHLSLGIFSALREIVFTRKLSSRLPGLVYYYMGFYIHSCPKINYKGAFKPSFLLCPEVFTWHPIKECLPKLDVSKYSRFNEDPNATDSNSKVSISEVLILYNRVAMSLACYLKQKKCDPEEIEEIMEYAKLIGKSCTKKMLLFRH